jgi:hypothetical protein
VWLQRRVIATQQREGVESPIDRVRKAEERATLSTPKHSHDPFGASGFAQEVRKASVGDDDMAATTHLEGMEEILGGAV